MFKHLLATTASIALIATPIAYAQDASNTGEMDNAPIFSQEPYEGAAPTDGFYQADPNQILATRFIGASIHGSSDENAEIVGDVNDIIMTPDGKAVAVIAGVGGFLGIGEKEVAVSIDELTWVSNADGDHMLVGDLTKEELENAPAFDRDALDTERTSAEAPADEAMTDDQQMAEKDAVYGTDMEGGQGTDKSMTTASTPRMETTPVGEASFEASELIGMTVSGANNETVGEVSDVLVDKGGKINAFVIDVGGFLGINEKPVAVSMRDLQLARVEGSNDWTEIKTGLTKESLESQKAYTEKDYMSDSDAVILIAPAE